MQIILTEICNSDIVPCNFLLAKRSDSSPAFTTDTVRSLHALEFRSFVAAIQRCIGLNLCG